ncbi:phospholipid-transporting ATPase ABCA3-like isoform X3 [Drosophila kikkawai]|uniref:Phospholipid-transporting ATPase ABCA3-like isoform X3 n=1 Tax=Drosophila kikkawai TaxID=30033 RepID=A0ABM4GG42_DROKI
MFALLAKNFRTYTRLEILLYLLLPLLMLHLVILRCHGDKNTIQCSERRNGLLGGNTKLYPLQNFLESSNDVGLVWKLLLYTNADSMADKLVPALRNSLQLSDVIRVKNEANMAKYLINGNYLGGILWKVKDMDTEVTIRFPSILRTRPDNLWHTDKRISDLPESYYSDEGFLQIINAITAFLSQPDSNQAHKNSDVTIASHPFILDGKYKNYLNRVLFDPTKRREEYILGFYLGVLYIYPFIRLVMHMTREKTRQQVDLMNMAGSNRFLHYLCWFISTFVVLFIINLLTIFLLKAAFCKNGSVLQCSNFWALLFVFFIWSLCGICFCFLVYSLINNVILAAFVAAFFCILGFLLFAFFHSMFIILDYILSILLQYAFLAVLRRILYFEYYDNTGLQWHHMISFKNTSQSGLTNDVGYILSMMGIVALISLLIAFFAELIVPGRYGISVCRRKRPVEQPENENPSMIVEANNLRKWQNNKAHLRNFSMNMYQDQITVLLGPSDSGKSAILHSISRSIPLDSGWVRIDNVDIMGNPEGRSSVGLAPQHNALFPNLTVRQHTTLYTSLRRRGSGRKLRNHSAERYLRALDLWDVRDVKSRNLSQADQKKLAVTCAFCGDNRIILLDEPSEGLNPCERRMLWDMLQTEKRCRAIIMTTYHIDEADALADRVAILCDGQLKFSGSAAFLKNTYGTGYQLVCSQGLKYHEKLITSLIEKYVPNTSICCHECETSCNIPQSSCCGIVPLLKALEKSVQCQNIDTIQIGTMPIIEKYLNATASCCENVTECPDVCRLPEEPDGSLLNRNKLCFNQWQGMTLKKFYHIKNNLLLFILLPLLLSMAFAGLLAYFNNKLPFKPKNFKEARRTWISQEPLKLDLDSYGRPCSYAISKNNDTEHPLIPLVKYKFKRCTAVEEEDLENATYLNDKHIFALRMNKCNYEILYSRKWLHSEAVAASLMAYLANNQLLDKYCSSYEKITDMRMKNIDFYNYPYPALQHNKIGTTYKAKCLESDVLFVLLLCLSIFTGFFLAYIIRERVLNFKLLQKVEGINMATFWLSHLLWDWLWLTLFSVLLVCLMSLVLWKGFSDEIVIPFQLGAPDFPFGILYLIPIYTAIAMMHRICEKHPKWSIFWAALPYLGVLIGLALLYFTLLLLYEKGCPGRKRSNAGQERVTQSERRNNILLLDNVRANDMERPVKDVTFGLRPMDILGLIGERSGKTTLNKLIISQQTLSKGHVFVHGIDVHNKTSRYRAFQFMGYCPENNYFEPKFTGRENLKIFSLIRGIKSRQVRDVSEDLSDKLNFRRHLDKRARMYTISDKRKLSTAIAVLGSPPLIILDQPTTGLETAHRSYVLDVLKDVNQCGSAILLSSNNMGDFQTLCNRLALMNRGQLYAIGPVASYRNQLSRGLILMAKARPYAVINPPINMEDIVDKITRFLLANFGDVYLLEDIQGDMLFYINNSSIPLAKAFRIIEKNRHELYISDFYLKHEDIELSFVTQNFRIVH